MRWPSGRCRLAASWNQGCDSSCAALGRCAGSGVSSCRMRSLALSDTTSHTRPVKQNLPACTGVAGIAWKREVQIGDPSEPTRSLGRHGHRRRHGMSWRARLGYETGAAACGQCRRPTSACTTGHTPAPPRPSPARMIFRSSTSDLLNAYRPPNGTQPHSSTYIVTPAAHTSAPLSYRTRPLASPTTCVGWGAEARDAAALASGVHFLVLPPARPMQLGITTCFQAS